MLGICKCANLFETSLKFLVVALSRMQNVISVHTQNMLKTSRQTNTHDYSVQGRKTLTPTHPRNM